MIRFLFAFATCCLLLCCAKNRLNAQQTPYSSFYRNNWQSVNPAAIDRSYYLKRYHNTTIINVGSRLQWIGLEGAPLNYFVSAEYCPELGNGGSNNKFGFTAYGDKTDAISTYGLYGNYSYFFSLPYKDGHILHFGISPGLVVYNVDVMKLRGHDGLPPLDDAVALDNKQRVFADFAFGMMYRIRKKFYFGLSVPQTFGLNLKNRNPKGVFDTDRLQHINLQVGGFIDRGRFDYGIDGAPVVIEPSAIMRIAPGVTFQTIKGFPTFFSMDANLRVHLIKHRIYGGIGMSTNKIASLEGGFNCNIGDGAKLQLGMAYGIPLGRIMQLGHSVEVNLSYFFL